MQTEYDIVVVGGGPGGICAAMAAAEGGLSVLLIERYGFLGGMATAGLVNPFMPYRSSKRILANRGFMQIIERMSSLGAMDEQQMIFDDEIMRFVLDEMMDEAGVELLLHSQLIGADVEDGEIVEIAVATKSEIISISASVFIDATGDGDLAFFAGVPFEMGRKGDGACQPMTMCFRLGGIKLGTKAAERHKLAAELNEIYASAKEDERIDIPRENVLLFGTLQPGVIHFNTTRVIGCDGTSSEQLTNAELEGRRQTRELVELFRAESPLCKDAWLIKMASQIGIRETRRIKGHYQLGVEELLAGKNFADGIARSNYPVDIHNPTGGGTDIRKVNGEFYEIPYRCLVPVGCENLIMGCRAISASHEAHSSLRVMPVVASIGEAAGTAAAICVNQCISPKEIDGTELKKYILK